MKLKAVIIIGGGLLQVPAVQQAHALEFKAIVFDRNPQAAAMLLADAPVVVDTFDSPAQLAAVDALKESYELVGVVTVGADCEVPVAKLAAYLGLPGIPVASAEACRNKAKMRQIFSVHDISPVRWREVRSLAEALDAAEYIGYPLMVKAVDNSASRGVRRIESEAEMDAAFADALANGTTGTVLLEEVLEGDQQSVELLFEDEAHCYHLSVVDRYFDGVMELGHVSPSRLGADQQRELFVMVRQAAGVLGVKLGAFKADTILTADGPRILEVTARLSGGFDSQYTNPLATGRNLVRAAIEIACGLEIEWSELRRKRMWHAAAWAAFPKPGVVKGLVVREGKTIRQIGEMKMSGDFSFPPPLAEDVPGVKHVFYRVGVGDVIEPYQHCAQRPAFVISQAETYAEALEAAKEGARRVAGLIYTEPVD